METFLIPMIYSLIFSSLITHKHQRGELEKEKQEKKKEPAVSERLHFVLQSLAGVIPTVIATQPGPQLFAEIDGEMRNISQGE